MASFDMTKFRKLGTDGLRRAVGKLMTAAGTDPETQNLDSYDREGLLDLAQHWGTKAPGADKAEVTEDGDVTGLEAPAKKVRRHRAAKFADGAEVSVDGEGPFVVDSATWDEDARDWHYVLTADDDTEMAAFYAEGDLKKYRAPKAPKVSAPRQRKLSDDQITELRQRRLDTGDSYAKLAAWLKETHDVQVTGDLVRSIVVGEIYTHVPMPAAPATDDTTEGEDAE